MHFYNSSRVVGEWWVCSHFTTAQLGGLEVHKKLADVAPKLPKYHVFHLNVVQASYSW